MYLQELSSLQFFCILLTVVIGLAALSRLLPGHEPPPRLESYPAEDLAAHDGRLGKYFLAGAGFLVLGAIHMAAKNLPWVATWLARGGEAGHLVRDLSNTHLMIVGGGTLIATGLCWYVLPRIVGRPLASDGLAQCAFWFTAVGLVVFYVGLVANGIAMTRLVAHGWDYHAAKAHMGKWYRVPVGMGAGVMGVGYWCFAANVLLTTFQARLVHAPKPRGHLAKFLVAGALGLTVGTVQGVIQVQPHNADWLWRAQHAGEWIDPISHAHINLVTGLTMLVAGALFYLLPLLGGVAPSRRTANLCFWTLLGGSLSFYAVALYLGFHEGHLVVVRGLTPEQAEEATPLHPYLIMAAGTAMMAAFWLLLVVIARGMWRARGPARPFVLAGCAALAVGTLQGPVQAFPAVNELLDRAGDAGDVIVNLHAQLNMLGGLMLIMLALALVLLGRLAGRPARLPLRAVVAIGAGVGIYYAAGIAFAAVEGADVRDGAGFGDAVAALEPWSALFLVSAALAVLAGFAAYAHAAWEMTEGYRRRARRSLAGAPAAYTGRIPRRVRRQRPAVVAAYELPLAVLGFPGVGWLFAGFPFTATIVLLVGPAIAWALIPLAFSPFGDGPLRAIGWRVEFGWLAGSALLSTLLLYRAHRRRLARLQAPPPSRGRRARTRGPREAPVRRPVRRRRDVRARIRLGAATIVLVLVAVPVVPAVSGVGSGPVRYSYQSRLTPEITGEFLSTPRGKVKLFTWQDPQSEFPADALRVHAGQFGGLLSRAAAVDAPDGYRLYDLGRGREVALRIAARSKTALTLAPARRLATGRYLFVSTHEGMFGGRDYSYLRVVSPGAAVTPIGRRDRGAPAVVDAFLPLAAALLAALFVATLARSWRRRPAGEKLLWAGGFAAFALAAGAEAAAQRAGWTPALFRAYYLGGGVLTVAWLGAGSAWLQLRDRGRPALAGGLLVATLAAAAAVLMAPVDTHVLAVTASGRPPANDALRGHAYVWAIALNSAGTVLLLGGSVRSVLRRRRVRANVWIAAGALVLAGATSASRAGDYSLVYLGELVGIALMFAGFTAPEAPAPAARPRSRVAATTDPALTS